MLESIPAREDPGLTGETALAVTLGDAALEGETTIGAIRAFPAELSAALRGDTGLREVVADRTTLCWGAADRVLRAASLVAIGRLAATGIGAGRSSRSS